MQIVNKNRNPLSLYSAVYLESKLPGVAEKSEGNGLWVAAMSTVLGKKARDLHEREKDGCCFMCAGLRMSRF